MTLNTEQKGGSNESEINKVSDLFNNLVLPNWTLSYHGGNNEFYKNMSEENYDTDDSDDVIDEELHEKLLGLVQKYDTIKNKKKITKKHQEKEKNKKTSRKRKK